eukprot:gnl/MRDRNA2_/MRDRNA2_190511_c0_seq1.p1 gnl/MRDRNA2_/MRDRNA2_190511_c0~~gnl/MRDRNA2_/MRDRNA2_190511_c0_seq1.p1  ORF type:complete len:226 (+),score=30.22 gnl/MRDRNA2_/MRDRNA2_190511_c0_seq1:83-760(+)
MSRQQLNCAVRECMSQLPLFDDPGQGPDIRRDLILWLNEETAHERNMPAIAEAVLTLKKAATQCASIVGGDLLLPRKVMLSCYDGGAHYVAHRDGHEPLSFANAMSCLRKICSSGSWHALETLHSSMRSEMTCRELTLVLYLNEVWHDDWGGSLRCYVGADQDDMTGETASEVVEVAPQGGTIAVFPSREMLHEVQPSWNRRFAMTMWVLNSGALDDEEISEKCL